MFGDNKNERHSKKSSYFPRLPRTINNHIWTKAQRASWGAFPFLLRSVVLFMNPDVPQYLTQSALGFVTGSGAGENFNKSSRGSKVGDYYPGGDHFLHNIISVRSAAGNSIWEIFVFALKIF